MRVNTAELTGKRLDWAVAIALGIKPKWDMTDYWLDAVCCSLHRYSPSTEWNRGGPLIEEERVETAYMPNFEAWSACVYDHTYGATNGYGPTPLIAAMRCLVAAKLGGTVEIPENL